MQFGKVEIIDYDVKSELNTFSLKRDIRNFSLGKILRRLNCREKNVYKDISKIVAAREQAFDCFRNSNMVLSDKRYKYPDLYDVDYDIIVCGSDQIWNPDYNIPSFFLNFTNSAKKVVYAASIGKSTLTNRQKVIYGKLMSGLDFISVREESAKQLLGTYIQKEIEVVLDPTLLLSPFEWRKLTIKPQKSEEYIFCYFLELNKDKVAVINKLAKLHNKKIVFIPCLHNEYNSLENNIEGMPLVGIGPSEFLGLIDNSNVIITDSFHASVFSILFNKPFWVLGRKSGNYNMNTRIEMLLKIFHIEERLVDTEKILNCSIDQSNYNYNNIEEMKKLSLDFLYRSCRTSEKGVG